MSGMTSQDTIAPPSSAGTKEAYNKVQTEIARNTDSVNDHGNNVEGDEHKTKKKMGRLLNKLRPNHHAASDSVCAPFDMFHLTCSD